MAILFLQRFAKYKNIILVAPFLLLLLGLFPTVKAATYVEPYYRSDADGDPYNNYGFPGNVNPYTGKTATGNPDTYLKNYYSRPSSDQNPESLYRYLNPSSPGGFYIQAPGTSRADQLAEDQKKFDDELQAKQKEIQQRIYDLQKQDTSGILNQCPYPVASGCTTEDEYSQLRSQWASRGYPATMQPNLDECRAKIDEYSQAKNKYNQCIADWQNQKVSSAGDRAIELERLKKESDYYDALLKQAQQERAATHDSVQALIQAQTSCVSQHGANSVYNAKTTQRCECSDGFAPTSETPFRCMPMKAYCWVEAGAGATPRRSQYVDAAALDTNCACETGYAWNSAKTLCVSSTSGKSIYEQYQTGTGIFEGDPKPKNPQPAKVAPKKTAPNPVDTKTVITAPLVANPIAETQITAPSQPPQENKKPGFVSRTFNSIGSFFKKLKFW